MFGKVKVKRFGVCTQFEEMEEFLSTLEREDIISVVRMNDIYILIFYVDYSEEEYRDL